MTPTAFRADLADIPAAQNLSELLGMSDERFLYCTYKTFLDRHPDEMGLETYLPRIRAGDHKFNIIRDIASSDEAKSKNKRLPGLDKVARRSPLQRIAQRLTPIWLFVNPLARIRRDLRVMENRIGSSIDRLDVHLRGDMNHLIHMTDGKALGQRTPRNSETQTTAQMPIRARVFFYRLKAAAYLVTNETEN